MRKIAVLSLAFFFSLPTAVFTYAQDAKPASTADTKASAEDHRKDALSPFVADRYFHLDFVVREIGEDGKVANSRAYSVVVGSNDEHPNLGGNTSIRTGSRVPVYTNGSKTQFQYEDVGVNIDCRDVHLNQTSLSMHLGAEVSSIANGAASESAPVTRQNKWDSAVTLPLNKPTILFSSDNVSSKGKLQLELTATPIK